MSGQTRVTVLTAPASGAIAVIALCGSKAWELVKRLFVPATGNLPDSPELHRFWFGKLGTDVVDEVILAVAEIEPELCVEVHCHGGQRVVRWIVELFLRDGCQEVTVEKDDADPWQLLSRAPTLRTAALLLDQAHGALDRAIGDVLHHITAQPKLALTLLRELTRYDHLGRHLVEPWQIVIAGPPNVGKSTLLNALAGFQRAIVSDVAGTTRDVVTIPVAFDGWPMTLSDTAGLREAEGLEAEGIGRAQRQLRHADLVLWVIDRTQREWIFPSAELTGQSSLNPDQWLTVLNKQDVPCDSLLPAPADAIVVSALNGIGIADLIQTIVARLVPAVPVAGAAIPYTPQLADALGAAEELLVAGRTEEAQRTLRACRRVDSKTCWSVSKWPPGLPESAL